MLDTKIKILLIEDDPFLLGMYSRKFEAEGFKVIMANSGDDGIKAAKKEKPDIILLDILIPSVNGFEVLKHLKNELETKYIPVIILTNLSQREEIEQGLSLGAEEYLIKAHCIPSEIVEKVKEVLGKQKDKFHNS